MHYHLVILRAYWDEEIQEVKGVPHQVIVCKVIDTANQTPCRKHILSLSGSTEFRQCLVDWIINDFQQLDHYSSDKDLPKSIVDRLDKKILKALVMAGIPFSVIEIPFILNLFKDLRSGPRQLVHSSNDNYIVTTDTRMEYLISLRHYSSDSHTSEFLTHEIPSIIKQLGSDKFAAIVTDNASNCRIARQNIQLTYGMYAVQPIKPTNCITMKLVYRTRLSLSDIGRCHLGGKKREKKHEPTNQTVSIELILKKNEQ
ncbi:unnamed protein product [Rhizophagus irregularis]|uniref:DUF659 domain-containing protein n=1 Tax=Rhizophagus irregularis TaxID=588596 RepID=A0A915YYI2_9GLOM|nr:ribonuclease H-like domain-containing protein [Rhizophagus irregularis DAOM 181602=DAOM 197198]CAB4462912.1 unnamed protein product [Rhizophagus irregularis]CAB5354903.1 unnamed protein product [Rhizophagus irregularis]